MGDVLRIGTAGVAALGIALTDGWRSAVLALVAAGAILATRVRFAAHAAAVVLAVAALMAAAGYGPGQADRASPRHHERDR